MNSETNYTEKETTNIFGFSNLETKNRTVRKDKIFEALNLFRSENSNLMKVAYISVDYVQKISGHSDFSVICYELNGGQQKFVPTQKNKQQSKIFLGFCIWNRIKQLGKLILETQTN